MVNAMTMRIHQSGHLARLSGENKALIKEALDYYKGYRHLIGSSLPFWPLGMPAFDDRRFALGFYNEECSHLALWRVEDEGDCVTIPLDGCKREILEVRLVYPKNLPCSWEYRKEENCLAVSQPAKSARLFQLIYA